MPKNVIRITDLGGGLNTVAANIDVADNECVDGKNFVFVETGAIQTRNGQKKINTSGLASAPVSGLYRYYPLNGNPLLIASCGDTVYKVTDTGTKTALGTGFTAGERMRFAPLVTSESSVVYMCNGKDRLYKYTGNAFDTVGDTTVPRFKYIEDKNEILFGTGDPSAPLRVYLSSLEQGPEVWDDFIDGDSEDGGHNTNIKSLGGRMAVYQQNAIEIIYGNNVQDFARRRVVDGIGCVAPDSVAKIGNSHVFLGNDNVYLFDGNKLSSLSDKISNFITNKIDPVRVSDAVGVYYPKRRWYVLFFNYIESDSQVNDRALVYDFRQAAWTQFTNVTAESASVWDGPRDKGQLVVGTSESDGFIRQQDVGWSDDGSAVPFEWVSRFVGDTRSIDQMKSFRRWHTTVRPWGNWNMALEYFVNYQDTGGSGNVSLAGDSLWGTAVWGTDAWRGSSRKERRVICASANHEGKAIRAKLSHSGLNQPVTVYDLSIDYDEKKAEVEMGLIVQTWGGLTNGTTTDKDHVVVDMTAIYNEFNGNIEAANIADDTLTDTQFDDSVKLKNWWYETFGGDGSDTIGFVQTGLTHSTTSGTLSTTLSSGTIYVASPNGGGRFAVGSTGHTYTASKDTYVFVDKTGSLDFTKEVANGAPPPTAPTDSLLILVVVTDGTQITGVTEKNRASPGVSSSRYPKGYLSAVKLEMGATPDEEVVIKSGLVCRDSTDGKNIEVTSDLTIDNTDSGANGLDTGALAADTWYYLFVIEDDDELAATAGLMSASATSPTLPSQYDKFRRVGSIRTDSSSNFLPIEQTGNEVRNTAERTVYSATSLPTSDTDLDLSNFIPTISAMCDLWVTDEGVNSKIYSLRKNGDTTYQYVVEYGTNGATPGGFGPGLLRSVVTDSSQVVEHKSSGASGQAASVDVLGWFDPLT